jgi:hypothetical protein
MNDDEARSLLEGIDGPRPLPRSLRRVLHDGLIADEPLLGTDAARPLPDDLRRRLEATLLTAAPRPVPRAVRRHILRATADGLPTMARAAAVVVVLAAAVLVAHRVTEGGSGSEDLASNRAPSTAATAAPPATATMNEAIAGQTAQSRLAVRSVRVLGDAASPAVVGFDAFAGANRAKTYTSDAAAGASPTAAGTAAGITVNLSATPVVDRGTGVVLETAFVRAADLAGHALSVSVPVEVQARIAVAGAYPKAASGRAVVLVSDGEPWVSAAAAFESALRAKGVHPRRVAYAPGVAAGAPAIFLALSPSDARAYLGAHPAVPSRGIHAIASAADDGLAQPGVTVVSPFAPPGGAEEAQLRAALPDGRLSAEAIHGWVTAEVVAELLRRSGGAAPTAADLAALDGWSPGWGVTIGRPGAYRLQARGDRFVVTGRFRAAP